MALKLRPKHIQSPFLRWGLRLVYLGLLGGLPVYPTMGNHDICKKGWENLWKNSSSYTYWNMAQRQSFA